MRIDRQKFEIILAKRGLNYSEAAKIMGMSRSWLSRLVNSEKLKPIAVGKIAASLGVKIEDIIVKEKRK